MKAAELKNEITSRYGTRIFKSADSNWILNECARLADIREIDCSIYTACYGILWSIATGRLAGSICREIRDMTATETFKLITETAAACSVIGEVPQFIIRKLAA